MSERYHKPKIAAAPQGARLAGHDLAALAAEVISKSGTFSFQATGASMAPTIRSGESVLVRSYEFDKLKPGDIVMAYPPSGLIIVHRVVGRTLIGEEQAVITMGDNSAATDLPLTESEILGRVVAVLSRGRKADLQGRFCAGGGRLLALVEMRRIRMSGSVSQQRWRRRLLTASRLLLKRALRLEMRLQARP